MLKRNLWKLILTLAIAVYAVSELIPLNDVPFPEYIQSRVSAKEPEFRQLYNDATAAVKAGTYKSEFLAIRGLANERKVELSGFFPDLWVQGSNLTKRNTDVMDALLRQSRAGLRRGLDLAGGVAVTLKADTSAATALSVEERKEKLSKAVEIIAERIDRSGVVEPIVRAIGEDRIEVQLPGLDTKQNPGVLDEIKRPAVLSFHVVNVAVPVMPDAEPPPGYQVMELENVMPNGQVQIDQLYVKQRSEMRGEMLQEARVFRNAVGQPNIGMEFTADGRKRFAEVTGAIVAEAQPTGRLGRLAIVLDGKLYSAPTVEKVIDSPNAEITGSFTDSEAFNLANVLNNPLDLPLVVEEQYEVGASLAEDAISSGMKASVIGAAAVCGFMLVFYSTGGLVAVASLAINILIILGLMASFGVTMTLPGLAGIVLTIGMAVDANILIFERMREELALGKSMSVANQSGFTKALTTIMDAHLVQLIICGIMIWLGTGPIRGFGVTLAIGVVSTLVSVLITAHMVMEMLLDSGWVKRFTMRHLLKHIDVDFVKYGKPAFIGSWVVVLIGVGIIAYKGSNIYGIDFAGGDLVELQYTQRIDVGQIRAATEAAGVREINATYSNDLGSDRTVLKISTPEGQSVAAVAALQEKFPQAGFVAASTQHVGASMGSEIQSKALLAVGASMLAILIYIAFRFEFGFGVGAMFSSLHDILMTIGIFVMFGHQFSAPMVAAILCIAGYSINETVVVFDRIREELKLNPSGSLKDIVNLAINKVFARTIMTATTTFLAALALFLFGGGVLKDIAFTFLVGIITSTFSAIFIAAQVFYWWHKGDRKHVEAHADIAPKYEWQGASKASQ